MPESERAALQAQARQAIGERIVPAYRKFAAFFNDEYLPKTRAGIAVAELPDGKAYYDFLARYYTTAELSADQIHQTGLSEVARIRAEMEKVRPSAQGHAAGILRHLRRSSSSHKTRGDATRTARSPRASTSWASLPHHTAPADGVRPIGNIAPTRPRPLPAGASRQPRRFLTSIVQTECGDMGMMRCRGTRPCRTTSVRTQLELPDRPMFGHGLFRRYGEGGNYAEQGVTTWAGTTIPRPLRPAHLEMWRAVSWCRHAERQGWSREREAYFKDNAARPTRTSARGRSLHRHAAQALAYKLASSRFRAARKARPAGRTFRPRAFNDEVLRPIGAAAGTGTHIDAWIARAGQA